MNDASDSIDKTGDYPAKDAARLDDQAEKRLIQAVQDYMREHFCPIKDLNFVYKLL